MSATTFLHCPNCSQYIEILAVNCAIFRCGVYKDTLIQINPHSTEQEVNRLLEKDLIYGCGQPFALMDLRLIKCGWI
jgi:hypothetical protein